MTPIDVRRSASGCDGGAVLKRTIEETQNPGLLRGRCRWSKVAVIQPTAHSQPGDIAADALDQIVLDVRMCQNAGRRGASIFGECSVSRVLSRATIQRLQEYDPAHEVIYRDLVAGPVPHLTGDHLTASSTAMEDIALGERLLKEFVSTDVVVIGVAFYNLTISSQLKAWIDRIVIAGKTFR